MRSRAVSLPAWCCLSTRPLPPPSRAFWLRSSSSANAVDFVVVMGGSAGYHKAGVGQRALGALGVPSPLVRSRRRGGSRPALAEPTEAGKADAALVSADAAVVGVPERVHAIA